METQLSSVGSPSTEENRKKGVDSPSMEENRKKVEQRHPFLPYGTTPFHGDIPRIVGHSSNRSDGKWVYLPKRLWLTANQIWE